jgi:hypothetical protein
MAKFSDINEKLSGHGWVESKYLTVWLHVGATFPGAIVYESPSTSSSQLGNFVFLEGTNIKPGTRIRIPILQECKGDWVKMNYPDFTTKKDLSGWIQRKDYCAGEAECG